MDVAVYVRQRPGLLGHFAIVEAFAVILLEPAEPMSPMGGRMTAAPTTRSAETRHKSESNSTIYASHCRATAALNNEYALS
jgi:hypothetical protein